MCDPVTLSALGATIVSAAGSAAASGSLALATTGLAIGGSLLEYQQQKSAYNANKVQATQSYSDSLNAIQRRQEQEQQASAENRLQNEREYDATKARATVAAGEAGVSGLSVNALLNDLAGQQAHRQGMIDTNLAWTTEQLQDEKTGARSTMQSRINSLQNPSGLGLALTIGGQALGGYDKYKTRTDPSWSAAA